MLHSVFVAACGLSLVEWAGAILTSCGAWAFHCGVFSCGPQVPDTQVSVVVAMGLVVPWHVGSSHIRDQICVPCMSGFLTTGPLRKSSYSSYNWKFIPFDQPLHIALTPSPWQWPFCSLVSCAVPLSCPILCDSMDCSTSGFPVLHYLPEFVQTLVHWIDDAFQPSHLL